MYFIRFTENAEADLERGYSFVGYMLFDTAEAALENIADLTGEAYEDNFDLDAYIEDNSDLVGQDNVTGQWGQVRSGLCGFGPYASIEDAREALAAGINTTVLTREGAIFEGSQTFSSIDGQDEGITFRPVAIVETF